MYAATSNPTDRAREAAANRLWIPQTCRDGGLLGYGVDLRWCYWRAATHVVDKILKGTRPGDLPVNFQPDLGWRPISVRSNLLACSFLQSY